MLETVRMPKAVPIRPDTAALNVVLVSVRMLVVINARRLAVSIRRFVQVIIEEISAELTFHAGESVTHMPGIVGRCEGL